MVTPTIMDAALENLAEAGTESAREMAQSSWRRVQFHAEGGEYFRIWIVNLLLSVLTLGIYSAWATVRERRYLYGCTEVADSRFDFHGRPLQILLGRVLAVAMLLAWSQGHHLHVAVPTAALALIVLLFPWFLVRALSYRLRNTSLRNLRFDFGGRPRAAYATLGRYLLLGIALLVLVGWVSSDLLSGFDPAAEEPLNPLLLAQLGLLYLGVALVFVFLYPAFVCDLRRFSIGHTRFGEQGFAVQLRRRDFIGCFWTAIGLWLLMILALSVVMGLLVFGLSLLAGALGEQTTALGAVLGVVFAYLLFGLGSLFAVAWWQAGTFNLMFRSLRLEAVQFRSGLSAWRLAKVLLLNSLLMLVTLGLAYPWARVRLLRCKFEAVEYAGDLDDFIGRARDDRSALGDEVGDAFDLDFGFGV